MKILVSCDDYCYKLENNYYLNDFGLTLAKRYLMTFDKLRLAVRTKEVTDFSQLGKYNLKVDDPRIEIYPITFFQGPIEYAKNYFKIIREMSHITDSCNFAIFRLPSTTAFAAWKQTIKHNIPYAVELVYDCYDCYTQAVGIDRFLWERMHHKQVNACNKAIGIAPVTEHYLQKHYSTNNPETLQSHYSSIEMGEEFYTGPRKYPNKESLNLIHVANQVQFNGRKGHNEILEAITLLKGQNIKVSVTFVGEDYQNGIYKLKELANKLGILEQVTFTGFLKYTDMRQKLLSSDIAVLPTKAEGLPRVLIEAMAVGLPCIASNVSGNPELIEEEFLFEYGDINTLASQIKMLVTEKKKYEDTSNTNFNKSLEYCKNVLDTRRKEFFDSLRKKVEKNLKV